MDDVSHQPPVEGDESLTDALDDVLKPGIAVDDVPGLSEILSNEGLIRAFVGVFRGTFEDILLRLLVLSQMAGRGGAPHWAPDEIRAHLTFLAPSKVENTLSRLRTVDLLAYDPSRGTYRVTPSAFIVLAAWSSARSFSEQQYGDLGFLNAQIAGTAETVGVPEQILSFTLASTESLRADIENAIETHSMIAIRAARARVQEAFRWAEKGVELLERIAPNAAIGGQRRETARQLAQAQSSLLRVNPRLDRIIHQMEAQRVRLRDSGLSTTDIHAWLLSQSDVKLVQLAITEAPVFDPPPFFRGDIALDVAEDVLAGEVVHDEPLPPPASIEEIELPEDPMDMQAFNACYEILAEVTAPLPLSQIIHDVSFGEGSYRLSLLPLIGEKGEISKTDPASKLAELKLELIFTEEIETFPDGEIERMTRGRIEQLGKKETD